MSADLGVAVNGLRLTTIDAGLFPVRITSRLRIGAITADGASATRLHNFSDAGTVHVFYALQSVQFAPLQI